MRRGREYCADEQNIAIGHLAQVAARDDWGNFLRCPECGWYYRDYADGIHEPEQVKTAEIREIFGSCPGGAAEK